MVLYIEDNSQHPEILQKLLERNRDQSVETALFVNEMHTSQELNESGIHLTEIKFNLYVIDERAEQCGSYSRLYNTRLGNVTKAIHQYSHSN